MRRSIFIVGLIFFASMGVLAQNPVPSVAPLKLPDDPPPIAPNFEAPVRALPAVERVGVDVADQLPLSLKDAIRLALKNNNDIDTSNIETKIAEFGLDASKAVYDLNLFSDNFYERRSTPTASVIGGAVNGTVTLSTLSGSFGINGFTRKGGGSYSVTFSSSRTNTSNSNATLNPQFPSALVFSYTQPLFRGRRIDNNRRNIEIAKKNITLTDFQFKQKAADVVSQVELAYWDLVYALRNLKVQIDAVKDARVQLESNKRLAAKGVIAPIEIVAANAQITTFEQNVYTAQETVTRAENLLKTLMLPDRADSTWSRALVPDSPVDLEIPRIALDQAVKEALTNREELAQLDTNQEINKINERFFRDQLKPQIDLVSSYTSAGLAGSTTAASINPATGLSRVPQNLIGGYINSLGNLVTQDYPTYRVGVTITLPFGHRAVKANLGTILAEADQLKNSRAQTEQGIEADVRNSLQALRSAEARLQAAAATRASNQQLYESEQRQFRAGTSTAFLVFQRQNELVIAQGRELQAQTDLNKAISTFHRAIGTTLSVNDVEITKNLSTSPNQRRPSIDTESAQ